MISQKFFNEACASPCLSKIQSIPKCDMHNHAGRGGRLAYIQKYSIKPLEYNYESFLSIQDMNDWFKQNITDNLPRGSQNYLKRVEATFVAASNDNIVYLALDFGLSEVFALGGMKNFIEIIELLRSKYAPNTILSPVVVIRDEFGLELLPDIFSFGWFDALDIINYDNNLSDEVLSIVCQLARDCGVKCKAHVGEYGTADDIFHYVELLNLDEIQHGIKIVESPSIMEKIAKKNITFNICPTSNVKLGLCNNYESHPIKKMFEAGLNITINTDDLLIFNSSVSEEYYKLLKHGVLNKDELYQIYINTMKRIDDC